MITRDDLNASIESDECFVLIIRKGSTYIFAVKGEENELKTRIKELMIENESFKNIIYKGVELNIKYNNK